MIELLKNKYRLGMVIFLVAESAFLGSFMATYVFYGFQGYAGPQPGDYLTLRNISVYSGFLWASGITAVLGRRALLRLHTRRNLFWVVTTLLFAGVAIGGESDEWYGLIREGLLPSTGIGPSTFYVLTGFHALHVLAGMVMWGVVFGVVWYWHGKKPTVAGFDAILYYWIYVVLMWLAIYSIVYIWTFV